ncbi:MAG TPA: hypothetical protein VNA68_02855 [Candidatus Dormibacteraeota bacterium]|nr:hypothetical protein [Candidatus Dormibacteraeota bacterium]
MEIQFFIGFIITFTAFAFLLHGRNVGIGLFLGVVVWTGIWMMVESTENSAKDSVLSNLSKRCVIEGTVYQYPGQDVKAETKKLREAVFDRAKCTGSISLKVVKPEAAGGVNGK